MIINSIIEYSLVKKRLNYRFMKKIKQVKILKGLCVLTFAGSSFGIIKSISLLLIKHPKVIKYLSDNVANFNQFTEKYQKIFEQATIIGSVNLLFYMVSIVGAVMMLKLNKKGFYLYTVAQFALVFTAPLVNGFDKFPTLNLVLCLVWVLLYANFFVFNKKSLSSSKLN